MPARQSISLLALSALLVLPAGIANAGEINIQNGNTRVRVGQDSGVSVETTPASRTIRNTTVKVGEDDDVTVKTTPRRTTFPLRLPNSRVWIPKSRINLRNWKNFRTWKQQPRSNSNCVSRSVTRQHSQSNSSGTAINRTYSSQTSTTCQ